MTETNHKTGHRQRLRQRFIESSAIGIPDYEILEILLFASKSRGDVKPLAKNLIKEFGSFAKVISASPHELSKINGVGQGAIAMIKVAQEASFRLLKSEIEQKPILQSWKALLDYCYATMALRKIEQFRIFFLDNKNILISDELQQEGTINHTPVYPREVVKRALELGASSIILTHNHPSGDPTPSKADIAMTKKIVMAVEPIGISVHDHLIIGNKKHFSFANKGML